MIDDAIVIELARNVVDDERHGKLENSLLTIVMH